MSALTFRELGNEINKMTDEQKDSCVLIFPSEVDDYVVMKHIQYCNTFDIPNRPVLVDVGIEA